MLFKLSMSVLFSCFYFLMWSQQSAEPVLSEVSGDSFYTLGNEEGKKLLIYLHGGIRNPYFDKPASEIEFDYLIEGNTEFVRQAVESGFQLIAPISNDSMNWLIKPERAFSRLQEMIESTAIEYDEIYISGYSDGGTGSYKIFYTFPESFDGLVVFNGYPHHNNFFKSVNYNEVTNKKVLFCGTYKDKTIPYEFLLVEYSKQKKRNANTFLYITKGKHDFACYEEKDLSRVFDVLTDKNICTEKTPVHGFLENDELVEFYPFRKKILKRYGRFGEDIYRDNRKQQSKYK